MSIVTDINSEYGNVADAYNPILKNILTNLDEFGFLDNLKQARSDENNSIKTYKNLENNPNSAAALEIIIDCISRGLLESYLKGFEQGSTKSDGSSNISFQARSDELLPLVGSIDFNTTNNVHQAIIQLANELVAIKNALKGLGIILPSIPPTSTIQITLK